MVETRAVITSIPHPHAELLRTVRSPKSEVRTQVQVIEDHLWRQVLPDKGKFAGLHCTLFRLSGCCSGLLVKIIGPGFQSTMVNVHAQNNRSSPATFGSLSINLEP